MVEIEVDDVHLRAIAAIDIAENNIRTKEPRIEIAVPGTTVNVSQSGTSTGVSAVSADTELSSELSNFPDLGPNVKLITLHMAPSSTSLAIIPISGLLTSTLCFQCRHCFSTSMIIIVTFCTCFMLITIKLKNQTSSILIYININVYAYT
jgi:hypothetical protein